MVYQTPYNLYQQFMKAKVPLPLGTTNTQGFQPAEAPNLNIPEPVIDYPAIQEPTVPDMPAKSSSSDNTNNVTSQGVGALLGGPLSAAVGVGAGLLGNLFSGDSESERENKYLREMMQKNKQQREHTLMQSPQADFLQSQKYLQGAMDNAGSVAANAASGQSANQGLGGDIGFSTALGQNVGSKVGEATAPIAGQMAGNVAQRSGSQANKLNQLQSNLDQQAELSQLIDYITKAKKNPFANLMSNASAGMSLLGKMGEYNNDKRTGVLNMGTGIV